jgi:hypothetical protein
MKRMTLVTTRDMNSNSDDDGGHGGGPARKYECDNCRAEFPNKTTADRHMLFCRTLAEIRRGGGASTGGVSFATHTASDDPLMPTQREMFVLIQELAAKYNKVKDELDVMKQWAKMVGRRVGGGEGTALAMGATGATAAAGMAGLDFTSITRQKRQNMEIILNEEDAERPEIAELRPAFSEWLSSDVTIRLSESDLNIVFHEDLVTGITSAILRILSDHTVESGKSHLIPFRLADIKQGAFYIYDTGFKVGGGGADSASATDLPATTEAKKWRTMEPCEFQLLVRTFHKLLFKEFKKWQDRNWEAQQQMTQKRQKAASSYQQMMASAQQPKYQCSPAMASCDGMYPMMPSASAVWGDTEVEADAEAAEAAAAADAEANDEPVVIGGSGLSEDFATLYNKYADKMMGGALSDDTILSRVRAKLWKDMKAWRL